MYISMWHHDVDNLATCLVITHVYNGGAILPLILIETPGAWLCTSVPTIFLRSSRWPGCL